MKKDKKCNEELVAHVKAMINTDARILLEEIASALNILSGSASSILPNRLSCCTACVRWIPQIVALQQKRNRGAHSSMLLKIHKNWNQTHLDELVTGDDTWLHCFEPLRKAVNKELKKKVLYTIFFCSKGLVVKKPSRGGKSITGDYYRDYVIFELNRYHKKSLTNLRHSRNQTCS